MELCFLICPSEDRTLLMVLTTVHYFACLIHIVAARPCPSWYVTLMAFGSANRVPVGLEGVRMLLM